MCARTVVSTIGTYKVEPYVLAADVYNNPQHAGRGGWTWYTGAAGWMYRLITESLLGLRLEVDRLYVEPLMPAEWGGFVVHYRYHQSLYHLNVRKPAGSGKLAVARICCDGEERPDKFVALSDDGKEHQVDIHLCEPGSTLS